MIIYFSLFLGIKNGDFTVVLSSPEAIVEDEWIKFVKDYAARFCVLAFDEAHVVVEW